MDRYPTTHEEASPTDIVPRELQLQELPSRSYYSAHGHYGPGDGMHYSASIESIRARSLALGDLYLKEGTEAGRQGRGSMANSSDHGAMVTALENVDEEDSGMLSPTIPVSPRTDSNLSYLLRQNMAQKKDSDEHSPLLKHPTGPVSLPITTGYQAIAEDHLEAQHDPLHRLNSIRSSLRWHKSNRQWRDLALQPLHYIPAVVLGVLLNLLDAISYGMITFPLNNPIFASFGPDGISMFFVSCIVSQLVYSGGLSTFDGGNGSMMIEVVPFLHIMAEKITQSIGQDHPQRVIASTVVAFALSTIMTGVAFFLLGALKLGSLIGFFPRHILVGTIGGVGWFLVTTGIETSGRLDQTITYTIPMFQKIFLDTHTLTLWTTALAVALLLRILQHRISSPLLVPAFFMTLPLIFYLIVFVCRFDVDQVRNAGWIFPLVESNLPFWHFYTYYDLTLVDWRAVAQALPAMLALTFFGVLHVPINVPALGVSTRKDDVNVNRELVAHGVSNALSGMVGSVQNYLVYTNSLLFIRSGGDSRLAGFMLAGATTILWMVGPWIVGYIPVMVVGSLIFHLGLDLLKEALVDTWNSVHYLEYITICVIVACMATLGFVEGIFIGIVMACIFFVVQNARRSEAIRATHTGVVLRSTVRRLYRQQMFLNQVGSQIQVVKLQGYLFFGTINQVERAIRVMLDERAWDMNPIRFLILDLQLVQGLDFSAAEAFVRIRRLLSAKKIYMIICNVTQKSDEERALVKAGMWVDHYHRRQDTDGNLKCFERLDDALEWCENVLLEAYFAGEPRVVIPGCTQPAEMERRISRCHPTTIDALVSSASPRHQMLSKAVQEFAWDPQEPKKAQVNMTQPTLLLTQTLCDLSEEPMPMEFYHKLGRYFERWTPAYDTVLWREGDTCDNLLVLEQGSLRSMMRVNDVDVTVETILPGTVVGELGLFTTRGKRNRSLVAERDAVVWLLTRSSFAQMLESEPATASQFVLLTLYFSSQRLDLMTNYAFQLH